MEKNQLVLDQSVSKTNELKDDIQEFKIAVKEKDKLLLSIENKNGLLTGELKAIKEQAKILHKEKDSLILSIENKNGLLTGELNATKEQAKILNIELMNLKK